MVFGLVCETVEVHLLYVTIQSWLPTAPTLKPDTGGRLTPPTCRVGGGGVEIGSYNTTQTMFIDYISIG